MSRKAGILAMVALVGMVQAINIFRPCRVVKFLVLQYLYATVSYSYQTLEWINIFNTLSIFVFNEGSARLKRGGLPISGCFPFFVVVSYHRTSSRLGLLSPACLLHLLLLLAVLQDPRVVRAWHPGKDHRKVLFWISNEQHLQQQQQRRVILPCPLLLLPPRDATALLYTRMFGDSNPVFPWFAIESPRRAIT